MEKRWPLKYFWVPWLPRSSHYLYHLWVSWVTDNQNVRARGTSDSPYWVVPRFDSSSESPQKHSASVFGGCFLINKVSQAPAPGIWSSGSEVRLRNLHFLKHFTYLGITDPILHFYFFRRENRNREMRWCSPKHYEFKAETDPQITSSLGQRCFHYIWYYSLGSHMLQLIFFKILSRKTSFALLSFCFLFFASGQGEAWKWKEMA